MGTRARTDKWPGRVHGGDIITQVNGRSVGTPARLMMAMQNLKVGDTVHLTLFREGETQDVEFVLPQRPLLPQDIPGQRSLTPVARKNSIRCGPQYLYPARRGPPTPFLNWYLVRDSARANTRPPRIGMDGVHTFTNS